MARGASAAIALVVLALAAPAAAATPQQISQRIFRDLADNGRLDGHYTRAEINRALHTPSLRRYEPIRRPQASVTPSRATPPADTGGRALPFSGLDIALFGGVGAPLLLLGASLGRLVRVRQQEELG